MTDEYGTWGWTWRFAVAILLDLFDLLDPFDELPIIGNIMDAFLGLAGLALWGPAGGLQFLEVLNPIKPIDGFIPTLTIAGIAKLIYEKRG